MMLTRLRRSLRDAVTWALLIQMLAVTVAGTILALVIRPMDAGTAAALWMCLGVAWLCMLYLWQGVR